VVSAGADPQKTEAALQRCYVSKRSFSKYLPLSFSAFLLSQEPEFAFLRKIISGFSTFFAAINQSHHL
jgi:hypothetical protein